MWYACYPIWQGAAPRAENTAGAASTPHPANATGTAAPDTEAPTAVAAVTEAPTTVQTATEAPTTAAPITEAETTAALATDATSTESPTTERRARRNVNDYGDYGDDYGKKNNDLDYGDDYDGKKDNDVDYNDAGGGDSYVGDDNGFNDYADDYADDSYTDDGYRDPAFSAASSKAQSKAIDGKPGFFCVCMKFGHTEEGPGAKCMGYPSQRRAVGNRHLRVDARSYVYGGCSTCGEKCCAGTLACFHMRCCVRLCRHV